MSSIHDFIKTAATELGTDEHAAKAATGGLLGFLRDKVDGADFQALLGQIPGAADLLSGAGGGAGQGAAGGGGLLGGLSKAAGSTLGDKLGGAAGLASALSGSGLEAGKIDDFLGRFVSFAKSHVKGDVFGRILEQVPELKKLVG